MQLVVKVEGQGLTCMGSRFLAAAVSRRRLFTSCRLAAEIARNWPSLANPAQPHPAHRSDRHPNLFHLLVCSPSLPKEQVHSLPATYYRHAGMGTTELCIIAHSSCPAHQLCRSAGCQPPRRRRQSGAMALACLGARLRAAAGPLRGGCLPAAAPAST